MLKNFLLLFTGLIFLSISSITLAESGSLFSIQEDCHVPNPYAVVICLNGKGPITCQNYIAHATHLTIKTIVPNQIYSDVGIKVQSSLYTPTNCAMYTNGYCLFSASETTSITIVMQSLSGSPTVC